MGEELRKNSHYGYSSGYGGVARKLGNQGIFKAMAIYLSQEQLKTTGEF